MKDPILSTQFFRPFRTFPHTFCHKYSIISIQNALANVPDLLAHPDLPDHVDITYLPKRPDLLRLQDLPRPLDLPDLLELQGLSEFPELQDLPPKRSLKLFYLQRTQKSKYLFKVCSPLVLSITEEKQKKKKTFIWVIIIPWHDRINS